MAQSFARLFERISQEELEREYNRIIKGYFDSTWKASIVMPEHVDKDVVALSIEVSAPKFKLGDRVQIKARPSVVFLIDEVRTKLQHIMRSASGSPKTQTNADHAYTGVIVPQFSQHIDGWVDENDLQLYDQNWDKKPTATVVARRG